MKSSIPGLADFPGRAEKLKTASGFIESKRRTDGAEGLWRIHNGLYDLSGWMKSHPGGEEWLRLTQGTDITELFESHHISDRAERMLPKFYVRDAKTPRSAPFTFEPDGFYRKFKKRAVEALRKVDYHHSTFRTRLIADTLAIATVLLCVLAAVTESWIIIASSAVSLTWTIIVAHNFFHARDNFRMYYFDLSLMSSKDWRVTHVISHHMYTNTTWDHEIYSFEPLINWLPLNKSVIKATISAFYCPFLWTLAFFKMAIMRYYGVLCEWRNLEFRDVVPFVLPLAMCTCAPAVVAIKVWLIVIALSSTLFMFIGTTAAHHHPDIFHDGDIYRKNMDWGLLEMDAVRDRKFIDESLFLVLTNFGSHGLHHLLPTVDHAYLPLCLSALYETCREFGIGHEQWDSWTLMKGQFQQLMRVEPKPNFR